jgi:DNA modification methylase
MMGARPEIEMLDADSLIPYANNTRTHSEDQVLQIASSIKEFGFTNPILVDADNGIIAGHGRVLAARKLGIAQVPCIRLDHLDERQKRAYIIADNKLALNAGWDDELLALELGALEEDGFDQSLTGFDKDELSALMLPDDIEGQTDEDAVPEVPEEPNTVDGDIWLLGRHRLMCGDSTSVDAVEKLMDGQKADMVFTDPPYALFGNSTGATVADDKMIRPFFRDVGKSIFTAAKPGAHFYSCLDWKSWSAVMDSYAAAGLTIKNMIVWDKGSGALGAAYRSQHELIMFGLCANVGISITKRASVSRDQMITDVNVWKCSRENNKGMHAALKPQEIIKRAIENSSLQNHLVLDLFGGSGSTLIASESTSRACAMMEMEPKYCDVIVQRWQDYTGQKAVHAETGEPFDG